MKLFGVFAHIDAIFIVFAAETALLWRSLP
jgi:hypothetical protein